MPVHGQASSGVLLVGEAPGEQEAKVGRPFVGAAGFYLDRVLKRAGLDRNTFAFHNVLSCRPPNNRLLGMPYQTGAIAHCSPYLDRAIRDQQPKVVVALGNTALRRLVPSADGIARHRGFVLQAPDGQLVVPTYHPSFLLPRDGQANTSRFLGVVIRDLRRAVRIAQTGFSRLITHYLEDPKVDVFATWVAHCEQALEANPDLYLSFDIETPYKLKKKNDDDLPEDPDEETPQGELPVNEPILRISFSYAPGTAVTVPWRGEYLPHIRYLLGLACRKVGWNVVRFDIPVIESHGVTVNGRIYDYMWGFHMWQSDLPKSLEFAASLLTDLVPWKHTSESEPAKYNAMDSDAQLRCAIALESELKASGQWDIFNRHVVDLDPLLMQMGARGVLIDQVAQDALRVELEGERDRIMVAAQKDVPRELRPTTIYKTQPDTLAGVFDARLAPATPPADCRLADYDVRWVAGHQKVCSHCGQIANNKTAHFKGGKKGNVCKAADATIASQDAWVPEFHHVELFNPNSVQQLIAYARHFGHPVAANYKTEKDTLDKKAVLQLAKTKGAKHPIYHAALTLRSVRKTLGTYVEGFRPDSDGLIHTTFGHHPSSLRLSSRNVNLQNVSHRGGVAYADRVRRTIVPRPGHIFVEADSSAIEAVMTGFFMGSAEYVALAKRGIHDYLTCLEQGMAFDEEGILKSKSKELKPIRDRNKQTVHGVSYGMTAYLLYKTYPDTFPHIADAERSIKRFLEACPGLAEWQHDVRTFAHKQAFLANPWGYRHYFYDVFTKNAQGQVIPGSDGNRCVSFLPQSSAAAFMKDNILLLAKSRFWPMPAIGIVHDAYALEVLREDEAEAVQLLRTVLTRPILEMGGLTIGCDVNVAYENWNDQQKAA